MHALAHRLCNLPWHACRHAQRNLSSHSAQTQITHRLCNLSHEPNCSTSIDQAYPFSDQLIAQCPCSRDIRRVSSTPGSTEDAHFVDRNFHRAKNTLRTGYGTQGSQGVCHGYGYGTATISPGFRSVGTGRFPLVITAPILGRDMMAGQ